MAKKFRETSLTRLARVPRPHPFARDQVPFVSRPCAMPTRLGAKAVANLAPGGPTVSWVTRTPRSASRSCASSKLSLNRYYSHTWPLFSGAKRYL
jgi:hypothetical protein